MSEKSLQGTGKSNDMRSVGFFMEAVMSLILLPRVMKAVWMAGQGKELSSGKLLFCTFFAYAPAAVCTFLAVLVQKQANGLWILDSFLAATLVGNRVMGFLPRFVLLILHGIVFGYLFYLFLLALLAFAAMYPSLWWMLKSARKRAINASDMSEKTIGKKFKSGRLENILTPAAGLLCMVILILLNRASAIPRADYVIESVMKYVDWADARDDNNDYVGVLREVELYEAVTNAWVAYIDNERETLEELAKQYPQEETIQLLNFYELTEKIGLRPAEEREETFRKILPRYGFNGQEIDDFVEYWVDRLPAGVTYVMYPQLNEIVDQMMPVSINPEPDSILRLWFLYEDYEGAEAEGMLRDISETDGITGFGNPQPLTFERNGFTVVEWGGSVW